MAALKFGFGCMTSLALALMVLLALPQCRLRSVGMCLLKWLSAAGLVLLTVSPIDIIPDGIPFAGLGDDVAYIVGAVMAARSALKDSRRAALPDQSQAGRQ